VHPEPHAFVVNIADFLKLVTGGTWQSTVHRVRNMGGEERYSMPFFFSPNEDAKVSVLEQFRKAGELYEEFGVGEYFQKRLDMGRRIRRTGVIESYRAADLGAWVRFSIFQQLFYVHREAGRHMVLS
jgi:hypothetical protein